MIEPLSGSHDVKSLSKKAQNTASSRGIACQIFQSLTGSVHGLPEVFEDDLALAGYLLEEAKVALVPGSAFGAPGFMRLSYASSEELLTEGVRRIREALS